MISSNYHVCVKLVIHNNFIAYELSILKVSFCSVEYLIADFSLFTKWGSTDGDNSLRLSFLAIEDAFE